MAAEAGGSESIKALRGMKMKDDVQQERSTRREFLGTTCPALAGLALGLGLMGCDSGSSMDEEEPGGDPVDTGVLVSGNTITLDLSKQLPSALAAANGFLFINRARVVALNVGNNTIRAFTSICTHEACDVTRFANGAMECPCHGSRFNTSGQAIQGPASQPLTEYTVARDGDMVTITKS